MLGELSRRRVLRTLTGYCVACFVLLQVADVTFQPLGLGDQHVRLLIGAMLLGLPIVGYLAWALDVVPENERVRVRAQRSWLEVALATTAMLALAIGVVLAWLDTGSVAEPAPQTPQPVADRTIAVLPFRDLTAEKGSAFLAEGMTEEIITLLGQVPDLRVSARTSSYHFQGSSVALPDIARQLGVAHVLEGSLRRVGETLRLTTSLVQAETGFQLWSRRYEYELNNIFRVQDEIADAVVQALQIKLAGGELLRQAGGTENLEAYQHLLAANQGISTLSAESLDAAEQRLNAALKLDPDYGLAYARLGEVYLLRADAWLMEVRPGYQQAGEYAARALTYGDRMVDALSIQAFLHRNLDWDWAKARAANQRALAISPQHYESLINAGLLEVTLGNWKTALDYLNRAKAINPMDPNADWNLATALLGAGQYEDAETALLRVRAVSDGYPWVSTYVARSRSARGDYQGGYHWVSNTGDPLLQLFSLPVSLYEVDRKMEAVEALTNLIEANEADPNLGGEYPIALAYFKRNEPGIAFDWLDRAYAKRSTALLEIKTDHHMKPFRQHPRYLDLMRRMNLPVE